MDEFSITPPIGGDGGKILVTGANGQLGKELQQIAASYPQYNFIFLSKAELPLDDFDLVRNIFTSHQPQFCINCAAYTAVDKAEEEKELAFRINGEAVGVLAAICKEQNCQLIHISTDYVFDGTATAPYKEDSPTNPQSVYGASKLEGERQAMQFNPDSIIIRTSWLYSAYGKNFVRTMLKLMQEKDEINVVNDQFGSPTYAADLAEMIMQMINRLKTPDFRPDSYRDPTPDSIYHFSNEGSTSWYDFALAIKELTGSRCKIHPIPTSQFPTLAKRPAYSVLDKTKIIQHYGIMLKDWKESLAICIARST